MNKKLRLLVTEKCNRNCPGCCNKQYDINSLPVITSFFGYEEIMITGGEPLLFVDRVINLITAIKLMNDAFGIPVPKIYIYTALNRWQHLEDALTSADGITFTLHSQQDAYWLRKHITSWPYMYSQLRSVRLNVFEGIMLSNDIIQSGWKINYKTWQNECPIPSGEDFMRLPKLFE